MLFTNDKQILTPDKSRLKFIALAFCIGLFITALFSTAFCNEDGCKTSVEVLLAGFFITFFGGENLCWLANPFLIIAWVFIAKNKAAAQGFAWVAFALSLIFLIYSLVISSDGKNYSDYIELKAGYWLWLSSCVATLVFSLFLNKTDKK